MSGPHCLQLCQAIVARDRIIWPALVRAGGNADFAKAVRRPRRTRDRLVEANASMPLWREMKSSVEVTGKMPVGCRAMAFHVLEIQSQ